MTDRLTVIRQLEKEIADKQAALAAELSKKEVVKKDDIITGIQPLTYRNNWENDVYTIQGKRVLDLKQVSIGGKEYEVTSKPVSVGYTDCGHSYTSTSKHYFVTESVFGKSQKFDLNTLMNRDVKAVKYTLEYELK